MRSRFEISAERKILGGQIFRQVLDSKYHIANFCKYPNLNFPTFGRAEGYLEKEECLEPQNSPRSYLSNKADSRSTSRIRMPVLNFTQADPEARQSENIISGYKKLKIPRLTGFQLYPSFANELNKSHTATFTARSENPSKLNNCSSNVVESSTESNTHTFEQHETTQSDKDSEMIGLLTRKEREAKVKRYLDKKKRRQFNKKVCYESRKKVADTRPRYKGRFVSFEQAGELVDEFRRDLERKLEKERIFITEIFDKKTKNLRKIIFPNEETLNSFTGKNVV